MRWVGLCAVVAPGLLLAQAPPGYYENIETRDAPALRESLHELIDDHQRYPYTSHNVDTWDILEEADRDPDDDVRIITLYRNSSHARRGGGNDEYNREHTWPKSYGFPDNDGGNQNYPYTDLHHLFLSDIDYNSARSNKPYEDCAGECEEWPTEARGPQVGPIPGRSNWTVGEFTEGRWEVWAGRRGDVARAMFYMDVRYEGGNHGVTGDVEPDLRLTNDRALIDGARTNQNESVAWMGMLDTLLAWHAEDPPDATERRHHETVAAFQGNRNPFIDHPQWVNCVYLAQCEWSINPGLNDAWFDPATAGQGFFVTVYPQLGLLFLAHFTFDSERPSGDPGAVVGAPGQRWITAIGPFSGDSAELTATLTSGGVFDDPTPTASQSPYGTYQVTFHDCNAATITYAFPEPGLSGNIDVQRVVLDNVALCESLASGDTANSVSGSAVTTRRSGPPAVGASKG